MTLLPLHSIASFRQLTTNDTELLSLPCAGRIGLKSGLHEESPSEILHQELTRDGPETITLCLDRSTLNANKPDESDTLAPFANAFTPQVVRGGGRQRTLSRQANAALIRSSWQSSTQLQMLSAANRLRPSWRPYAIDGHTQLLAVQSRICGVDLHPQQRRRTPRRDRYTRGEGPDQGQDK